MLIDKPLQVQQKKPPKKQQGLSPNKKKHSFKEMFAPAEKKTTAAKKRQKELAGTPLLPLPNLFSLLQQVTNTITQSRSLPPSTQFSSLKSPLFIQQKGADTFSTFIHESAVFGKLEFQIEQNQNHSLHYHMYAPLANIHAMQGCLPLLLAHLQKTLPLQKHHIHGIFLKNKGKKKKYVAQYP